MKRKPPIYLAAGDTARNPSRSGIPTTVRALARELGRQHADRARLAFWNHHRNLLHLLPAEYSLGLAAEALRRSPRLGLGERIGALPGWLPGRADARVPLHRHPLHRNDLAGAWLLLPELLRSGDRVIQLQRYARRHGMRVAAIFYDALAIQYPEFSTRESTGLHRKFVRDLATVDLILPISATSAEAWRECLRAEGLVSPPLRIVPLAAEISGVPRVLEPPGTTGGTARALCVSTVEPRKNHLVLCQALEQLDRPAGTLPLEIDLIGAPDPASPELEAAVAAAEGRFGGRLRWFRHADTGSLRQFFQRCDFTVYPSVAEGFGLPIFESLWFARPCVCANFGVMGEHARDGGCLAVDVRDPAALADALRQLSTDGHLRHRLALEASQRPLRTWREYADDIVRALDEA